MGLPDGQVPTFCALCVSRCGATATIENGTFVALRPDPSHPTGSALCVKGKAAPEIVAHPDRLLYPLRRTTAKGAADPGWERISWDEALDLVRHRLLALAREHGPECVTFGAASPSTSALSDSVDWVNRLRRAFGSPNLLAAMELCGWGRYFASMFTYGEPVPGSYMPDLERAGCILFWGYNPSVARLAHATATTAAVRRGARLVVVDPRRAGLASKADHWLRVRPGTDGALALSLIHVMLANGWWDEEFVRRWTDAPLLVRDDTGRRLRASDVFPTGSPAEYVAWDAATSAPVAYSPGLVRFPGGESTLALRGTLSVPTPSGVITCRPVFELVAGLALPPEETEPVTGVPAESVVATARTLWESRPLAFYAWSGVEQHDNATQTARAIGLLYALTGCLDTPGGNVLFTPAPAKPVDGPELISRDQQALALGLERRPLSGARYGFVTGEDFYRAALEGEPYRARGLVNFGSNLVMAHGESAKGRDALSALDFFVHIDLFMSPTAELADVVLPVASAFEAEALRVGFEVSQEAQSLVQLRKPVSAPRGEARSDLEIIFALATRLGLGEHFFDGDLDAAWRHQLAPTGLTLERLRAEPAGVRLPLETVHRKYAVPDANGVPRGFRTPTRRVELFSEVLAEHGYAGLPAFVEPGISPRSRPDLAAEFPLVLTCAKGLFFCETQHRQIASLRRSAPGPQVEVHPDLAASRRVAAGDWVRISTPSGAVRARARFNSSIDPSVVVGQHGWWQGCPELGLSDLPVTGADSANLNLVLSQTPSDPVSGSSPLRASVCEISLA